MRTFGWIASMAFLFVWMAGAVSSSVAQAASPTDATLEARIVTDPRGCPMAVDVWLKRTTDSIQGIEVYLAWDRPGVGLFETSKVRMASPDSTGKDSLSAKSLTESGVSARIEPRMDRSRGLLRSWEYVAARGETGTWVKVTGIAYLVGGSKPRPICPGDTGLLFRLPVKVLTSQKNSLDGDSAIVLFDRQRTRYSDTRGKLFNSLDLHDGIISVLPCRKRR